MYGVRGNIIYTKDFGRYEVLKDGYILINKRLVKGVYKYLPEEYDSVNIKDYGDKLIIPGFVDLHLHGPQFPNLGLGLDKELLPWLESYTFPEERKYHNLEYAKRVYKSLIKELWKNGTTRCVIFASIHLEATKVFMELLNEAGLGAYVGKVNMDRNCPEFICENTDKSLEETEIILRDYGNRFKRVKPIISPRFVPTCTPKLLHGLGELSKKYKVPVQSHLSENVGEIELVRNLHPEAINYASIYKDSGLLGQQPTIMAHCVLLKEEEIELLGENKVFIAHCPNSNANLSSGVAPLRRLLSAGIPIGLASDISGGHSLSMSHVIVQTAQMSNLKWLESGKEESPLTTPEVFYLATKGGGSFFGKVGSFEEGYEFDALVIDDRSLTGIKELSLEERLQKFIYTGSWENIEERYIGGEIVGEPEFH